MKHKLPSLPYPRDALEPFISGETIDYHYGKHHAAYIAKLNASIPGTEFETASLEDIVRFAPEAILNNGAQAWNHAFYWKCLAPDGGGNPNGELGQALSTAFSSVAEFRNAFTKAAENLFGSGWVWLVQIDNGGLAIMCTANADNPMRTGHKPLLVCDVWEHAYYIDYRNARPDYLKAFWRRVNWDFVARTWAG